MTRTRRAPLAACAAALVLALAPALWAQDPAEPRDADVVRRLDELERGQKRIEQQLEEIKRLVEGQARPAAAAPSGPNVAGVELDLGGNPVKGQPGAKLVLVELTDYQ